MATENSENGGKDPFSPEPAPELVFGIVAPLGIDLDQLIKFLKEELQIASLGVV